MRHYTEAELERFEGLVADAQARVVRQQAVVDQAPTLEKLNIACSVFDSMTETLALYEAERLRILEALTRSPP